MEILLCWLHAPKGTTSSFESTNPYCPKFHLCSRPCSRYHYKPATLTKSLTECPWSICPTVRMNWRAFSEFCTTRRTLISFQLLSFRLNSIVSVLPFKRLDPRTPHSVKQILYLASKYDVDHIRHRIIGHVEQDWPRSLWQWDQIETEIHSLREIWHTNREPALDYEWSYIDDHLPEPASAIRLARECDIPSILPAAFYHLSRLSIYDDWKEARKCIDVHSLRYVGLDIGRRTADWSLLAADDFICLLKGQARLSVAAGEMLQFGLDSHEPNEHPSDCCSSLKRSELVKEIREACRLTRDLFLTTRGYMERRDFDNICQCCHSCIRDDLSNFRRHLWNRLPDIFSLK
jgi:hypothetical protein